MKLDCLHLVRKINYKLSGQLQELIQRKKRNHSKKKRGQEQCAEDWTLP